MKIRPMGVELVRTDGRTDVQIVIVAFDNFANDPTKLCPYDIPYKNLLAVSFFFHVCSILVQYNLP